MAALGIENFLYVEKLQQRGVDAVGLSGVSGRLLVAKRKDVRAVKTGRRSCCATNYTGTSRVGEPPAAHASSSGRAASPS
jgi:acetylglutamate/LysW-gamma-L-alpha-aminoadipate kinase